jgi:hypothetical protein
MAAEGAILVAKHLAQMKEKHRSNFATLRLLDSSAGRP